jgi:hypothetical protein
MGLYEVKGWKIWGDRGMTHVGIEIAPPFEVHPLSLLILNLRL